MKHIVLAIGYGILGLVLGGLAFFVVQMRDRPDLEVWHTAVLDREFAVDDGEHIADFDAYLKLESRVFEQLHREVYARIAPKRTIQTNRFHSGSWSDPTGFDFNWNRTFELKVDNPKAVILMIHGLSDSPYSMRALALSLHRKGAWVVGLRLPGHGTAPAGLTTVHWRDFASAVRLAARYMNEKAGDVRPFYIVGYSNGAALALEYCMSAMEEEALPQVTGLVMLSPALAVQPTASLAKWSLLLSHVPYLEKLAWLNILPEYDPYKYNSFAINAGVQIHSLTKHLSSQIDRAERNGKIQGLPPILAAQSVVDATVPSDGVVKSLFQRLSVNKHRLILFDVNRKAEVSEIFSHDPLTSFNEVMEQQVSFSLSVVTNLSPETLRVVVRHKEEMATEWNQDGLDLMWPEEVYSLSHVAVPFSADDPLYGPGRGHDESEFTLGRLELRGERALLQVPIEQFMRLRYNPFYPYLEKEILDHVFSE